MSAVVKFWTGRINLQTSAGLSFWPVGRFSRKHHSHRRRCRLFCPQSYLHPKFRRQEESFSSLSSFFSENGKVFGFASHTLPFSPFHSHFRGEILNFEKLFLAWDKSRRRVSSRECFHFSADLRASEKRKLSSSFLLFLLQIPFPFKYTRAIQKKRVLTIFVKLHVLVLSLISKDSTPIWCSSKKYISISNFKCSLICRAIQNLSFTARS